MQMIVATVSLTLIALAAGTFLLAKAVRENLGLLYKITAYFIIVLSLLNLGCSALHFALRIYSPAPFIHVMKMKKHGMEDHKGYGTYDDHCGMMHGGGMGCSGGNRMGGHMGGGMMGGGMCGGMMGGGMCGGMMSGGIMGGQGCMNNPMGCMHGDGSCCCRGCCRDTSMSCKNPVGGQKK